MQDWAIALIGGGGGIIGRLINYFSASRKIGTQVGLSNFSVSKAFSRAQRKLKGKKEFKREV